MNTLYLPELREALAQDDATELKTFCEAIHPIQAAEFMEGLTPEEAWRVLSYADPDRRTEIFSHLPADTQVSIVESQPREEVAAVITDMAADDRVDMLGEVDQDVVNELLEHIPDQERIETLRLSTYPEGTAGSIMTTEVACLPTTLTVRGALMELARQAEDLETLYYIYVVDDEGRLNGTLSARQLITSLPKPQTPILDLVERDMILATLTEDVEDVARKVAKYNLLAIPVVDEGGRLVGIITHDDVIDVVREEAAEDAQQMAAVSPLEEGYLEIDAWTLAWKRGIWLLILFTAGLGTAFVLGQFEDNLQKPHLAWLVMFIPLIISTGGNTGAQSATLVITALAHGDLRLGDWGKVLVREIGVGLILGGMLALFGTGVGLWSAPGFRDALVVPITLLMIVMCGALSGGMLPLIFRRLGLNPALMSNPFVAVINDIVGILIYMTTAMLLIPDPTPPA